MKQTRMVDTETKAEETLRWGWVSGVGALWG